MGMNVMQQQSPIGNSVMPAIPSFNMDQQLKLYQVLTAARVGANAQQVQRMDETLAQISANCAAYTNAVNSTGAKPDLDQSMTFLDNIHARLATDADRNQGLSGLPSGPVDHPDEAPRGVDGCPTHLSVNADAGSNHDAELLD